MTFYFYCVLEKKEENKDKKNKNRTGTNRSVSSSWRSSLQFQPSASVFYSIFYERQGLFYVPDLSHWGTCSWVTAFAYWGLRVKRGKRLSQPAQLKRSTVAGLKGDQRSKESSLLVPFSSRSPNTTSWRIGNCPLWMAPFWHAFSESAGPFSEQGQEVEGLAGSARTQRVKRKIKVLSARPSSPLPAHTVARAFNGWTINAFTPLTVFLWHPEPFFILISWDCQSSTRPNEVCGLSLIHIWRCRRWP